MTTGSNVGPEKEIVFTFIRLCNGKRHTHTHNTCYQQCHRGDLDVCTWLTCDAFPQLFPSEVNNITSPSLSQFLPDLDWDGALLIRWSKISIPLMTHDSWVMTPSHYFSLSLSRSRCRFFHVREVTAWGYLKRSAAIILFSLLCHSLGERNQSHLQVHFLSKIPAYVPHYDWYLFFAVKLVGLFPNLD